jgi:hypothetical protein
MMQLKQLVVYSLDGEVSSISFDLGSLNIITGRSRTGKSALIRIIEYCLGSGECKVPEGVIRESTSWYGLLLDFSGTDVFVARAEPGVTRNSSTKIHLDIGNGLEIPPYERLQQNVNTDGLVDALSQLIGIAKTET